MFKGSFVALVTPFKNGELDIEAFNNLIEWHIASGTHGLIPCGTTGETPTLTNDEQKLLIETCIKTVNGRIPVIAGTGSNSTEEAINMSCYAEKAGADAILVVTPYYNKPRQEGMYEHFKMLHDKTNLPIILYNVPSRTGVNLAVDTVIRLAKLERIVGIKDATPDLSRPLELHRELGDSFTLFSGEDSTVAAFLAQGGDGCISVTANVAPKLCSELHEAWQEKDFETFERIRDLLLPLHKNLFAEPNPAPAKYCLSVLGKINEDIRSPLFPISDDTRKKLDEAMKIAGIIDREECGIKKAS